MSGNMQPGRIAELLGPFLVTKLSEDQLSAVSMHLDLLLRWNARINLTSVREAEEIVTRHFGESLFVGQQLFPSQSVTESIHLADVGSGAGFPGLPIKIWAPEIKVTLIESNNKKATFLREVVRGLKLDDVEVFAKRAEAFPHQVEFVTLRAVENFEEALKTAIGLLEPGGTIALMLGDEQLKSLSDTKTVRWEAPVGMPKSERRVLITGSLCP